VRLTELQKSAERLAEREVSVSGAFWAPMVVGLVTAGLCLAWRCCESLGHC